MSEQSKHLVSEERQTLWLLVISPTIWAVHFLFSYAASAVWCGDIVGREGSIGPMRIAIGATAVVALVGIAITGIAGWRKHQHGEAELPHEEDTPEDRHRFLGYATVLLSCLSAVATVYVALTALFVNSCH